MKNILKKNILKKNNGAALAMIIVVATCGILLLTTLLNLSLQHYKYMIATDNKSTAYYIADYAAEKALKDIETMVASAKLYANQMMRSDVRPDRGNLTPYDFFVANNNYITFKNDYEAYYKNYLLNVGNINDSNNLNSIKTTGFVQIDAGQFANSKYNTNVDTTNFNSNFQVNVTTTGQKDGKFQRQIQATLGLNPWGYDSNGVALTPNSSNLTLDEETYYDSPQWTGALCSSGDIEVYGTTMVNGDVYVNGYVPDMTTVPAPEGSSFGGLIVGKNGTPGNLTVKGNIFSNNYVHIMESNSNINVIRKSMTNTIDQIYDNTTIPAFSEKASNFIKADGTALNPLNVSDLSNLIGSLGQKQTNNKFINYFKNTYEIQKQNGGFIYANDIQLEKGITNSNINLDGSAIVFDNVQVDGEKSINIGNNFYGYKAGFGTNGDYNKSSSIVVNNVNSQIQIGQRVYDAGIAYVTAFGGFDGKTPYPTAEAASIYKNFYSYRTFIPSVDKKAVLPNDSYEYRPYAPYQFILFGTEDIEDMLNPKILWSIASQFAHLFQYDYDNSSDLSISGGGTALDKSMIKLNNSIYTDANLSNNNIDMGYTSAALLGSNGSSEFMGIIGREADTSYNAFMLSPNYIKKSTGSLDNIAFQNYIADKYSSLMEVKALLADNGQRLTINNLMDTSGISSYPVVYKAPQGNIFIYNGDINVTVSGGNIVMTYGSGSSQTFSGTTYTGVIVSTNGEVTIDSGASNITIDGAVISGCNPQGANHVGILIKGNGVKTITFDKNIMLNLFRLPNAESDALKALLTSKRGIIEMFNREYNDITSTSGFKDAVDEYMTSNTLVDKDAAIKAVAEMYEITNGSSNDINDKIVMGASIETKIAAAGSKNYRIIKWKTIQ